MKTCTLDGCESKHRAKGLCAIHYARQIRKDNPQPLRGKYETTSQYDPEDFWQFVKQELGIK